MPRKHRENEDFSTISSKVGPLKCLQNMGKGGFSTTWNGKKHFWGKYDFGGLLLEHTKAGYRAEMPRKHSQGKSEDS